MNRTIISILILGLFAFVHNEIKADTLKTFTPAITREKVGDITFTYTGTADWSGAITILFLPTATAIKTAIKFSSIANPPSGSVTVDIDIPKGTYIIKLMPTVAWTALPDDETPGATAIQQTVTLTVLGTLEKLIKTVAPEKVIKDTATGITITPEVQTDIKTNDKIIFTTGDAPGEAGDLVIDVTTVAATYTKSLTFPKGTYKIFVKRSSAEFDQGKTIVSGDKADASTILTVAFSIFLGLFLF